jgi:DNA-directed RNA polymerase specialized sigma24 family protein
MEFHEDVARVARDPAISRLAERRAGSRQLAEDALQETYWNVARANPETIRDLRAFFCTSLIREIVHQRARTNAIPIEGIDALQDLQRGSTSSGNRPPTAVEDEGHQLLLAETLLARIERDRDLLMASVPRRSPDRRRYRAAIVAAARTILRLLLAGHVAPADWNAVLLSEYPQWYGEPGLARDAIDQRLSRARRDVQMLLRKIVSRDELTF